MVACGNCKAAVSVPDTVTLKQQTGDKYPYLSPLQKILKTLELEEAPFDGTCHGCGETRAEFQVPIAFEILVERVLDHDGAIRPSLGGITLVASGGEETWQTVTFPLLLCSQCRDRFDASRRRARTRKALLLTLYAGIAAGFIWFTYQYTEIVAALAGLLWLIAGIAWILRLRRTSTPDRWLTPWLEGIRWVPEAIAAEDEYRLVIGRPEAYEPRPHA
jgi:hypothetical protein